MKRSAVVPIFASAALFLFDASAASSQNGVPPAEMLDAMFPALRHKQPARPPLEVLISRPAEQPVNPACGLLPLNLVQTRGSNTRSFKLLGAPKSEQNLQPTQLLIRLQRLTVDADGSRRTYHPEDPFGLRVCDEHATHGKAGNKICALDNLGNAGIHVFNGPQRIAPFVKVGADQQTEPNPDFATVWATLWARIAQREPHWVDLNALLGKDVVPRVRLYYSKQSNAAAIFNSAIIPFKGGYPCQHGAGNRHEYFVAATTPVPNLKYRSKEDACSTSAYLDSLEVPFFVLPDGVFENLQIGDVAIGMARADDVERLVFGVVGDTGPDDQIGEGSISFVRKLRGTETEPINSADLGKLDIEVQHKSGMVSSLAVLVLGGTSKEIGQDYSPRNIEKVGRRLLAKWAGILPDRLRTCADATTANPLDGFARAGSN